MRHIFAPDPVTASPLCMGKPSPAAGLVAPARVTLATPAGTRGAVAGAIDLAAVATTTDQRLSVAFRTHEQPGRRRGAATGSGGHPGDERHDCRNTDAACVPSTVWSTASERNRQVRSAPCLPRNTGKPSTGGPAPRRPSNRPHIASATEDVHSATAAELSIH